MVIDPRRVDALHEEIRRADSRERLWELRREVESILSEIDEDDDVPQAVQDQLDDMYIRLIQWTKKPDCGPLSAAYLWRH